MEMTLTQEPMMTRLQLVEVLEKLRDVLMQIDNRTVDRGYVDYAALGVRLDKCIEKVQEFPDTPVDGEPAQAKREL